MTLNISMPQMWENLEETDKFLDIYIIARLNQEDTEQQNTPLSKKSKLYSKVSPSKKAQAQRDLLMSSFKVLNKIYSQYSQLFQEIQETEAHKKQCLWNKYHSDTQSRQRHQKKKRIIGWYTTERRC